MFFYPFIRFLCQRANGCGSGIELGNFMFLDDFPETVRFRISRNAFKNYRCCTVRQGTVKDIGVSCNPADICGTPVNIVFPVIEYIFESISRVDHITRGGMHHSFRFSGRSRSVKNKQWILSVHDDRNKICRCLFIQRFKPEITAFFHIHFTTSSFYH